MRLPFNTTCDIYYGPSSPNAGELRGTFPCRYVIEDGIFTTGAGVPAIPAYMTIDAVLPTGSFTIPQLGIDPGLADQVAIPSGTSPQFWVIYTDQILWKWHAPYYRAYLCRLPIPSGHGGLILNSSALSNYFWTWPPLPAGSGGVLLNSSGIRSSASSVIAAGGIIVNGQGILYTRRNFVSAGGVILNGGALYNTIPTIIGSGGVICNSSAEAAFVRSIIMTGGVMVNSAGDYVFHGSGAGPGPPPLPQANITAAGSAPDGTHPFITIDTTSWTVVAGDKLQILDNLYNPSFNGLWTIAVVAGTNTFELAGTVTVGNTGLAFGKVYQV